MLFNSTTSKLCNERFLAEDAESIKNNLMNFLCVLRALCVKLSTQPPETLKIIYHSFNSILKQINIEIDNQTDLQIRKL